MQKRTGSPATLWTNARRRAANKAARIRPHVADVPALTSFGFSFSDFCTGVDSDLAGAVSGLDFSLAAGFSSGLAAAGFPCSFCL